MKIAVGAITRRRPTMFEELLKSFERMHWPEDAEVIFAIAENDESSVIGDVVADFRARIPARVLFSLEPRPGIPMARNRVLDMALEEGCDLLTFVDDDERVTPDWLVRLTEGMEQRRLDLAGAPVHLVTDETEPGFWAEGVLRHMQERSRKRNRERAGLAERKEDHDLHIYTNNWCARLAKVSETGVRFDEELQFTGGSDTRFSRDFHAAGARIGWIPDAVVEDVIPARRLTLGYHLSRARDQSTNAYSFGGKGPARGIGQAVLRLLEAMLLVLLVPLTRRRGVVKAAFKVGIALGRLRGVAGRSSKHYAPKAASAHEEGSG